MNKDTPRIILATINAKYIHTSLAARVLLANLEEFKPNATILEFTLQERAIDIAEKLIDPCPSVISLSCYIWNITLVDEVIRIIKSVRPKITIILGGPEVSFPTDPPPACEVADIVVCGEGERTLPALLRSINDGTANTTDGKFVSAAPVALNEIALPFHLYSDEDIAHRMIYVEASRGCAYGCEFCLSSLDTQVRHFSSQSVIDELDKLWQRGVRKFKFIDRTIHLSKVDKIMDFFLARACPELFIHFEVVPDSISSKLLDKLKQFPSGAIQLEAGVQSFNPEVSSRIGRKQNMEKTEANIRTIVTDTTVHIHSDLVVGLPGETMESFGESFNRLLATNVHEIQVGILKRLRGAPINRHTEPFKMVYRDCPPYDILQNSVIDFSTMQRLKRFSRYFDLVSNNGNFKSCAPLIWHEQNAFACFLQFTDWLFAKSNRTAKIALDRLAEYLFEYLTEEKNLSKEHVANHLLADFENAGRRRFPKCVREFASQQAKAYSKRDNLRNKNGKSELPQRQKRHNQETQ